jgi:hypothetical protein
MVFIIYVFFDDCHCYFRYLLIFTFLLLVIYHWVDTSVGGLLVSESVIRPVVSAWAMTWFNVYIYCWNLQFLNNVTTITAVYRRRNRLFYNIHSL